LGSAGTSGQANVKDRSQPRHKPCGASPLCGQLESCINMESDPIEKEIEQIRGLPNAQVDCGTEQRRDRFFAQLMNHSSTPEIVELPFDWRVTEARKCLTQIENLINPYSLSTDYLSFLKALWWDYNFQ
jgi:hypothetical protein